MLTDRFEIRSATRIADRPETFGEDTRRMTHSARLLRMTRHRSTYLVIAIFVSVCGQASADNNARQTPTVKAIQAAEPAVVYIQGNKTVIADSSANAGENGKPQVFSGMGTGVIIDSRGFIVTNNHVVADVAKIEVTLGDGSNCIAKLLKSDPRTDLALIKVDVDRPLPVISIGSSKDLMLGETVIAIGNPFGYQRTVTVGIVSGLHRNTPVNGSQDYKDLIQTNADINPGNSGGPLINIEGDMVGINVAVRMGAQGIGFAIPVDSAIEVIADLVSTSQRNQLCGDLQLRNIIHQDARQLEVVSASSVNGATHCLENGDCIVAVDGQDVRSKLDFELALIGRKIGEQLPLTIRREGKTQIKHLTLSALSGHTKFVSKEVGSTAASYKENSTNDEAWEQIGIRVVQVGAASVRNNSDKYKGGLKVTAVRPQSLAAQQKIQVGDILVGAIGWKTPTVEDLNWVLNRDEFKRGPTVNLYIVRGSEEWIGTLNRQERNIR